MRQGMTQHSRVGHRDLPPLYRLGKSPSMGGDGDFKSPCRDLDGDFILSVCKAYHFSDIDSDRHHVLGLLRAKYDCIAFPSLE